MDVGRLIKFAIFAAAFADLAKGKIPDGSLSSCEEVAATFDNTCTGGSPLSSLANHAGKEVSCTGNDMRCPGGDGAANYSSSNPCTSSRKLCVTCSESNGVVKVKVQSNGLPNHCINSTVNNAIEMENEWEVVWNSDVNGI